MYILELFSGLECISDAFRKHNHNCFTIDWDKRFNSSLHCDIADLELSDLPVEFRHADIVFLGTDCTTYSVAAISKHRRKNEITGNSNTQDQGRKGLANQIQQNYRRFY